MEDDILAALNQMAEAHNAALGEVLYLSTILTVYFTSLVKNGVFDRDKSAEIIDAALLVFERNRASHPGSPAAMDHARLRMKGLLALVQAMPDRPPSEAPNLQAVLSLLAELARLHTVTPPPAPPDDGEPGKTAT